MRAPVHSARMAARLTASTATTADGQPSEPPANPVSITGTLARPRRGENSMTTRKAEATWAGSLREGTGEIALESGAFRGPYTFRARFEQGAETNPEELLGAAHAGCFTMAITALLARERLAPERIQTTAAVHLEAVAGGFSIPRIELTTLDPVEDRHEVGSAPGDQHADPVG